MKEHRHSKFGAGKIKTNTGEEFDSKLEYRRWVYLNALLSSGVIKDLERQVSYLLLPKQTKAITKVGKRGKLLKTKIVTVERECRYVADFVYKYCSDAELDIWSTRVEDTKGFKTPEYKLKKKMMLYFHNISIIEIKKPNEPIEV